MEVNHTQFPAIRRQPCGGDLWNSRTVLDRVLEIAPDAISYAYDIYTGLWADVTIETPNGRIERRIFG